jgi:hypothetical protein
MKTVQLGALIMLPLLSVAGCSSAGSTTGSGGESGTQGSGGTTMGSGGASFGGVTGSGGMLSSGGRPGTAGASALGSGGSTASGGSTTTGSGGGIGGGGRLGGGGRGGTSSGGMTGTGGMGGVSSTGGTPGAGGGAHFSFFATSLAALQRVSGNPDGFGGDLRFGESTGLAGADKICATIAETSMAGAGSKTWRAFLSTVAGPVNAKDRVGQGPWYDRKGRLVASTLEQLLMTRPGDADATIKNDFPNEDGVTNHNPDGSGNVDNHDFLTGTGPMGSLYMPSMAFTCNDWTSSEAVASMGPWVGHSWGAMSGQNWMSALREGGCGPGVNLMEMGGPMRGVYTVGTGGGYGGFFCFALTP